MTENELHEQMDALDGYRVVVVDNRPVSMAVYGEIFAKGRAASKAFPQIPEAQLLYEARADNDREFGGAQRSQHFADAVFRFFNTGGTNDEFVEILKRMRPLLVGPMVLPDGYYLLESYLNTDNAFEHVFVSNEQDEAVVWVEGQFWDMVPWEEIRRRLDENGRIESLTAFERLAAKREENQADLRQLPDRQDTDGAEPAE